MKKYVAICATLAALAWVGVAAAATPQGKLTGSADLSGFGGYGQLTITTAILDAGTSYVGLENDRSSPDTCSADSGAVTIGGVAASIVCAHFVASSRDGSGPKMRFAYPNPAFSGCYDVFRISDGGATDKVGGFTLCGGPIALSFVKEAVNTGAHGAGFDWSYQTVNGNYTVTASQT
jgi:opacity protein-like surface antigen